MKNLRLKISSIFLLTFIITFSIFFVIDITSNFVNKISVPSPKIPLGINLNMSKTHSFTNSDTQIYTESFNSLNFISTNEEVVIASPRKIDSGKYNHINIKTDGFDLKINIYNLVVKPEPVDMEALGTMILESLGDQRYHYGIYIYDLLREQEWGFQEHEHFPPASITKLPSVLLTLYDIDKGKYTLDSTIPVKDSQKHTYIDAIGRFPAGTKVSYRLLIDEAIRTSNNTAHYHLHDALGGMGIVNPRTQDDLGIHTFFLDPQVGRPHSVGVALMDLYYSKHMSKELSDHLINLLKTTAPSLRTAIPSGVPLDIEVANKVGFLFGGEYGSTFSDAAIVYGHQTDYVLVVLNNKAGPFPTGNIPIKNISEIVYRALN